MEIAQNCISGQVRCDKPQANLGIKGKELFFLQKRKLGGAALKKSPLKERVQGGDGFLMAES